MQAIRKRTRKRVGTTERYQINLTVNAEEKPMLDYFVDGADEREIPVARWLKDNLWVCKDLLERGINPEAELRLVVVRAVARIMETQDGTSRLIKLLKDEWPDCWDKEDRLSERLSG